MQGVVMQDDWGQYTSAVVYLHFLRRGLSSHNFGMKHLLQSVKTVIDYKLFAEAYNAAGTRLDIRWD